MRLVAGINNLLEAEKLLPLVDEFYFGVNYIKNHRSFEDHKNFNKTNALKLIKIIKDNKKIINLAVNEIYNPNDHKRIIREILSLMEKGLDGIILRDISLLTQVKKLKTNLILTSTAMCFNSNTISFFKNLGIKRIILPQHLEIEEIKKIVSKNKEIEFECFYPLLSYCPDIDGLCQIHLLSPKSFTPPCRKLKLPGPDFKQRSKLFLKILRLKEIKYMKITRDDSLENRINIINYIWKELKNKK